MSTINNALSKLAEQQSSSKLSESKLVMNETLVRASIAPVKSSRLVWAVGGFTLSLGLGAWAVTSAPEPIQTSLVVQNETQQVQAAAITSSSNVLSNTSKLVEPVHTTIYESPKLAVSPAPATVKPVRSAPVSKTARVNTTASPQVHQSTMHATPTNKTMVLASTNTNVTATAVSGESSMQVDQVELSHRQMADKAVDRANKALEANDFAAASSEFQTALRYVPEDENIRRKIAALYYGNGQVRKAAEMLEDGIKLNKNSTALRMSLAGILLKEDQAKAALNVLGYIPDNVTDKYLAMRAALAQKLKQNDWAKQSYEMLTQRDSENGRWWLGLGIQQERSAELKQAKDSYTKALTMVGLSSQSQSFIRDRIAVLTSLEQGED